MTYHPHELKIGVDVYSHDDEKLGELRRLVVRRADLSLTHIVVDIGFLRSGRPIWAGGFGLEYDRVAPIELVHSASDKRLDLTLSAEEFFAQLPEYTDESFEQPQDLSPDEFDIADIVNRAEALSAAIGNTPGGWLVEKLNRPIDSVDVREGTDVWRRDPHEKLGEVHRVLLDPESGRVRAFVIRHGFVMKKNTVLPARYAVELYDDLIHVDIADEALEQLHEYQEE